MTTKNTTDTSTEDGTSTEDTTSVDSAPSGDSDTTSTDTETPSGDNRREARYRRQLRDTEAERDALAEQITAMRRAEAERLAADTITEPAALWAAGTDLEDLIGDDGNIDPAKVATAATAARDQLGLKAPRRGAVPTEGNNPATRATTSFADAFAPR